MSKNTQIISIHITYEGEMTVFDMQDSLALLNQAFAIFHEETGMSLSESNKVSPKVVSVSKGSLVVDIVVPIACAMLPILCDIVKTIVTSNNKYGCDVEQKQQKWTDKDNYKVCKAVLKEYVLKKSDKSVNDFIDKISLSKPYGRDSIKAKIQNTKHLMNEKQISSSLSIAPLNKCSNAHRVQFDKACKDLKI